MISILPTSHAYIQTLLFVISQAKKFKAHAPCATFDQPPWLKALNIVHAENLQFVCRLGGFHTLMSFLGSICLLMKGSSVEDLFAEIYAENSATYMISRKVTARAARAHILAKSALTSLLMQQIKEQISDIIDFEDLREFYESGCCERLESVKELVLSESIKRVGDEIVFLKSRLKEKSRTSKLWLLYINYINFAKEFIYAERKSKWDIHLNVLLKMLNFFAATGHINYDKSAQLYLQQMNKLPETHPCL